MPEKNSYVPFLNDCDRKNFHDLCRYVVNGSSVQKKAFFKLLLESDESRLKALRSNCAKI